LKKDQYVLISPLNWGLGHATRITPVIHYFLDKEFKILLAADGKAYDFFRQEFPDVTLVSLPGMNVHYSKRVPLWLKVFIQIPVILRGIRKERKAFKQILKDYPVSMVISDNRYGLWHKSIPTVFVSHQLHIRMPVALRLAEPLVDRITRMLMKRFSVRWVPDFSDAYNLSGKLSHPSGIPNTQYIGPLSRLKPAEVKTKYDFMVLLSGPEPQRTIFEQKVLAPEFLKNHRVVIVRGLPEKEPDFEAFPETEIYAHLSAQALSEKMAASAFLICRSGYSTIMDLYQMKKPAVMVPTPGQTEQEYLARHLKGKHFSAIAQKDFSLEKAIAEGKKLSPPTKSQDDEFTAIADDLVNRYLSSDS
jgi:uncharacterized protein (TIGR00661 family)